MESPESFIATITKPLTAQWFPAGLPQEIPIKFILAMFTVNPQQMVYLILSAYLLGWLVYCIVSRVRKKEKAIRFALTSSSVLVFLGITEILAITKVVDYRSVFATPIGEPWRRPDYRLDPKLLYIRKPHARIKGQATSGDIPFAVLGASRPVYQYDVQYDANGFRNPKDLQKADIAVIGDSFVEADTVAEHLILTSLLANLEHTSVVNLGQIGYGPQQELEVVRRFALPLKPRVVLWMFFEGNDLRNLREYEDLTRQWAEVSPQWHSFRQRSFLKNFTLTLSRLLSPPRPEGRRRGPWFANGRLASRSGELDLYFVEPQPVTTTLLDRAASIIASAASLFEGRFVVAFIPEKFRVYGESCRFSAGSNALRWKVSEMPEQLRQSLARVSNSIEFLDLTPNLKVAAAEELVYFVDDGHWSPAGHRVAAAAVHRLLSRNSQR